MATASSLISIDEYLQTDYKPDVHFANGQLEERSVGKYDHGKIKGWIFQIFNLHAKAWDSDVTVEQRI